MTTQLLLKSSRISLIAWSVCGLMLVIGGDLPAAEPVVADVPVAFSLQDFRGKTVSLDDFSNSRCVVVAFLGTGCPLAKLYAGRLQELSAAYTAEEVAVIGVNSNIQDSLTEMGSFVARHELTYPMLKDAGQRLADQLGATRTPQVFLLDQQRRVRYQGRVDDQYLVGVMREHPQREDLKVAIDELLQNREVSVPRTETVGCLIGRLKPADESSPVTYSQQISRVLNSHCVQCHRPGDVAPFSLTNYEEVAGWGPMIAEVVQERRMPPWHADPHVGVFRNDISLNDEERSLIQEWVNHGCPEGDSADLPEPLKFVEGWQLPRSPDVIISMRETPYDIPAQGGKEGLSYQHFWTESGLTEDRWVNGLEVQPGNRSVVHHVIVYAAPEKGQHKDQVFLTAYVPGLRLTPLPEGAAKKIPAGSWLRFEVHYTPNGTPQQDLTRLGLLFADAEQVTHEVRTTVVGNRRFVIQPQLADQKFTAKSGRSPVDVDLLSLSPHMHLRGQSFQYEAEYPDGTREMLLSVPHYDFNWQTQYRLQTPKRMPAGTVIHCAAQFDNSPKNLANPDPGATVVWGDQSWEEMLLGYMDIMVPVEISQHSEMQRQIRSAAHNIDPASVIRQLDKNGDGVISREESEPAKLLKNNFDRVDLNRDGSVSEAELKTVLKGVP